MKFTQKAWKRIIFFTFFFFFSLTTLLCFDVYSNEDIQENKYVGVDACADCHYEIVEIYNKTSSKAQSNESVLVMREKLTEKEFQECLSCHTTGYGEESGFVSFEQTPHLAVVGCESCHGMGYLHTIEGSVETIMRTPALELCETCHDDSRVNRIKYDGRIHAGGH